MLKQVTMLTALLLLVPVLASASPSTYMKKDNPNELGVATGHDRSCTTDYVEGGRFHDLDADYRYRLDADLSRQIHEITSGVLTRSGIKQSSDSADLSIAVHIHCASSPDSAGVVYSISVDFLRHINVNGRNYAARMHQFSRHTSVGIGEATEWLPEVRRVFELAIADYRRANFDLVEDDN